MNKILFAFALLASPVSAQVVTPELLVGDLERLEDGVTATGQGLAELEQGTRDGFNRTELAFERTLEEFEGVNRDIVSVAAYAALPPVSGDGIFVQVGGAFGGRNTTGGLAAALVVNRGPWSVRAGVAGPNEFFFLGVSRRIGE